MRGSLDQPIVEFLMISLDEFVARIPPLGDACREKFRGRVFTCESVLRSVAFIPPAIHGSWPGG
jgi:hypothetical protein